MRLLDSDELLILMRHPRSWWLSCRALYEGSSDMAAATPCTLPRGHDGPHQGVEVFIARRAIHWESP